MRVYQSNSEEETEKIGEALAKSFRPGMVVGLCGGMGMGKTALTRGIARGLGFHGRVTSPTYAIVNEYPTNPPLFHFDLYRLSGVEELYDIGLEEYFDRGGVCVMEWFERVEGECPADLRIIIEPDAGQTGGRRILVSEEDKLG